MYEAIIILWCTLAWNLKLIFFYKTLITYKKLSQLWEETQNYTKINPMTSKVMSALLAGLEGAFVNWTS